MKTKFLLIILILKSLLSFAQKNYIVVIDPGHGGHDSGAVGYAGVLEKDITLAISIKLKQELNRRGIKAVLTRNNDKFIALKPIDLRSKISNALNADLFISLHLNAGANTGSGVECYVSQYKGADGNKRKSVILSELILSRFKEKLGFKIRGTQFANLSVLRNTIEKNPSILLELGFVSNKAELSFILGKGADLISSNIAEAILKLKKMNVK